MTLKKTLLLLLSITFLFGCSAPYQKYEVGDYSGYSSSEGPGNLLNVQFLTAGFRSWFIGKYEIDTYTLYRCAEISKDSNRPYFRIYPTVTHAIAGKPLMLNALTPFPGDRTPKSSGVYMLMSDYPSRYSYEVSEVLEKYRKDVE